MGPEHSQWLTEPARADGYRTDGREISLGHCQRCKAGVSRPDTELTRCPVCARDVCADCCAFEPELETHLCRDCFRVRRSAKRARQRSAHYLLLLAASAAAILLGRFVALRTGWTSIWLLSALLCAAGIATYAWHTGFHHACPFCEGRVKLRPRRGRFREYECLLCRQVWME